MNIKQKTDVGEDVVAEGEEVDLLVEKIRSYTLIVFVFVVGKIYLQE